MSIPRGMTVKQNKIEFGNKLLETLLTGISCEPRVGVVGRELESPARFQERPHWANNNEGEVFILRFTLAVAGVTLGVDLQNVLRPSGT